MEHPQEAGFFFPFLPRISHSPHGVIFRGPLPDGQHKEPFVDRLESNFVDK